MFFENLQEAAPYGKSAYKELACNSTYPNGLGIRSKHLSEWPRGIMGPGKKRKAPSVANEIVKACVCGS